MTGFSWRLLVAGGSKLVIPRRHALNGAWPTKNRRRPPAGATTARWRAAGAPLKNKGRSLAGAPSAEEPISAAKREQLELVGGLFLFRRRFFVLATGKTLADLAGIGADRLFDAFGDIGVGGQEGLGGLTALADAGAVIGDTRSPISPRSRP